MRAIILSAGFGKRLLPYTNHLAKPAIPFLGVPGISFPLFLTESLSPERIVFNLHHLPETIQAAVDCIKGNSYEVCFSLEQPNILDSGGGIKKAEKFLKGDGAFLAINGDTILVPAQKDLLQRLWLGHQNSNAIATLMVKKQIGAGERFGGVFTRDGSNKVTHFARQKTTETSDPLHFIGPVVYSDTLFEYLPAAKPSNVLYDGLTSAIADGHTVNVFEANDALWFETGNEKDFLFAERALIKEVEKNSPYGSYIKDLVTRVIHPGTVDNWVKFLESKIQPLPRA